MTALIFKVDEKISKELDLIKIEEGLGNRTSTFTFLIKYYLLTKKKRSLDESIQLLDQLLEHVNFVALPSPEEQLKDL